MELKIDIPVLEHFEHVADTSNYVQIPDEWIVGLSDIVNSTQLAAEGGYKTVNFVGAATISAVTNAMAGNLQLFAFGGDGAHFVVPPEKSDLAKSALTSVSNWARKFFNIELRVGLVSVGELRQSGHDVRATMVQVSPNVKYAMFSGGGIEWAERQMKKGSFQLPPDVEAPEPDLTGLSCQWGPVQAKKDTIASLIVKPADGVIAADFEAVVSSVLTMFADTNSNPVAQQGPPVKLPTRSVLLQSKSITKKTNAVARSLQAIWNAFFAWAIFKLSISVDGFEPEKFRREISENSDFRKYSDGLMMTLDCSEEELHALESLLRKEKAAGKIIYGIHLQDEALITCVVPSIHQGDHVHFIDGSDGGYAQAAKKMKAS